jgi:hypothetical protein
MSIPYGQSYTAHTVASARREVKCEHCSCVFFYQMIREGTGSGFSFLFLDNQGADERASSEARANVEKKLARGIDPVLCPKCQLFQQDMIPILKAGYRKWLFYLGLMFVIPSAIALVGTVAWCLESHRAWPADVIAVSVAALVVGLTMILVRRNRVAHLDPNALSEDARQGLAATRGYIAGEEEECHRVAQKDVHARLSGESRYDLPLMAAGVCWASWSASAFPSTPGRKSSTGTPATPGPPPRGSFAISDSFPGLPITAETRPSTSLRTSITTTPSAISPIGDSVCAWGKSPPRIETTSPSWRRG